MMLETLLLGLVWAAAADSDVHVEPVLEVSRYYHESVPGGWTLPAYFYAEGEIDFFATDLDDDFDF